MRGTRGWLLAAGVGVALLLTGGCGGTADGTGDGSGGGSGGGSSTTADGVGGGEGRTEDSAAPSPVDETMAGPVRLEISGGIAGVHSVIEVAPDGAVEVADRDGARGADPLPEEQLATLRERLAAVDFAALPLAAVSDQAADMFHYQLSYDGHRLLTDRTEDLGPVEAVIDQLADALSEREREGQGGGEGE
ncbi:hypothetical protein ACTWP5_21355 [Streptomyces sp. 4N509B]|uniref:hypothetical protein n=1 Tax=Streptomyces sp. 4N509B TaxID=3457413 RepID=UPI003FD53028